MAEQAFATQGLERTNVERTSRFEISLNDEFENVARLSEPSLKRVWQNRNDEIWNSYLKANKKNKIKK